MLWHMLESEMPSRRVKLFQNGRNQAVRIPRGFELPGQDAIMRKDGSRLIIEPIPPPSLLALLRTPSPIDDDFDPTQSYRSMASIGLARPIAFWTSSSDE